MKTNSSLSGWGDPYIPGDYSNRCDSSLHKAVAHSSSALVGAECWVSSYRLGLFFLKWDLDLLQGTLRAHMTTQSTTFHLLFPQEPASGKIPWTVLPPVCGCIKCDWTPPPKFTVTHLFISLFRVVSRVWAVSLVMICCWIKRLLIWWTFPSYSQGDNVVIVV